jgi:hypothetical protein
MSTLALIGSGNLGGAVARLAVAGALEVVLSNSRGPQTLSGLVDQLGKRATAATVEEAARAGDWVVLSIPFGAYQRIPVEPLAGKTVLETTNYFDPIDQLAGGTATSSELVQRHLAGAHVVKAFNTILARHLYAYALARPAGSPTAVPYPSPATTRPPRPRPPSCWTPWAGTASTRARSPRAGACSRAPRPSSPRIWPTPTPISPPASPPTRAARPPSRRSGPHWPRPTGSHRRYGNQSRGSSQIGRPTNLTPPSDSVATMH